MNFSVLMSTYEMEDPHFLSECLRSLNNQELKANEVILVEDGVLKPSLLNIIEEYRHSLNIISVKLEQNYGLATALNAGLERCSYNLVARMDTDDIAMANRFIEQILFMKKNPELDIIGAFVVEIDGSGTFGATRESLVSHLDIYKNLFVCPLIHPTVVFKKEKILKLGGFNTALNRRQDYELWFRCAKAGLKFANIPKPLLLYRFTENSHKKQSLKACLEQGRIGYKGVRSLGQPLWKGLACFLPALRSTLPNKIQHVVYSALKNIDPRQRSRK